MHPILLSVVLGLSAAAANVFGAAVIVIGRGVISALLDAVVGDSV